jgi:signal transduction histidine kinase
MEERKNEMNELLLTTLCHDLRGPLNNILGWIQLARTSADGVTWDEASKHIEEQIRIQGTLINHLLDLSRCSNSLSRERSEGKLFRGRKI